MNIYFSEYQENCFIHKSPKQWKQYGIKSFKELFYYLGYPLSKSLNSIDPYLTFKHFKPGQILTDINKISTQLFYIIKGEVKITTMLKNEERVLALLNEGNFATIFHHFFTDSPSLTKIEAYSDLRCICLNKPDYEKVMPKLDSDGLQTVVNGLNIAAFKYLIWQLQAVALSSFERVELLYHLHPGIFSIFHDKDLASLMCISRETFGRMKNEFFKTL